jgi:hypothetical protein
MASIQQQTLAAPPNHGFVMAMRARLTTAKQPPWHEWIIVSRWGTAGECLSIGRTRLSALPGKVAPIHLTPRQTALARSFPLPPLAELPTFMFAQRKSVSLSVAGDFAPVEGYVRLHGRGAALRLYAEGRCTSGALRSPWRVEAVRVAWIGEFIEGAAVCKT